jgi:hypothetical protein
MADTILLILGAVGSLAIIVYILIISYQVRGSRPVNVMLSMANTEKSAKTVCLGPYVESVCRQFPETLDV